MKKRVILKLDWVVCSLLIVVTFGRCAMQLKVDNVTKSKSEVVQLIRKVNDHWQSIHSPKQKPSWDEAAYQTGNMAAYDITAENRYREYANHWAVYNKWAGAKSTDKKKWKYLYGETDDYVLFGDWQTCFQTYIDLYELQPDPIKIARTKEVMEYQMSTPRNDYWWWSDGLYMVMPVMTKLYKITGNQLYLQKLYEYFSYADSVMYDKEYGLYYRDARYVYPKHKTNSGKKDFWSRGDGWVFAGLAKVLQDLPTNDVHRSLYVDRFKTMAASLKKLQQSGGYWTRSLLDNTFAPGPETSGTAFFIYGYLWGVNNGYLSLKEYSSVISKGWKYLIDIALQPDGTIGYIQPIGDRAIPGQNVNKESTANFGVGAFLLASSEMYKFLENHH